jgi:uncharacterized protein
MPAFSILTLSLWLLVLVVRGRRRFIPFFALIGGIHALASMAIVPLLKWPLPLVMALQTCTYVLLLPRRGRGLRSPLYHTVVSLPGSWWFAGTLLALPWALSAAVGHALPYAWLPFAIACVGLADSLLPVEEVIDVVLDATTAGEEPQRHRSPKPPQLGRPLRIVQITDPHLGAFMSERRLRAIASRAVARNPDLVLLTGDFLTMESNSDHQALARALAPLSAARGRTFACLGNHDYEALDVVRSALKAAGVQLLVDDAACVDTPAGPVQVLGFAHRWQDRAAHFAAVCKAHPRKAGALRLMLLHDPGAFRHVPEGESDLVFSGHTHGGQIGLLRLGLPHTIVSLLTKIPDHGLWARGRDRLYVHRGTGHYGFPLRLGVPAEYSMVQVHRSV